MIDPPEFPIQTIKGNKRAKKILPKIYKNPILLERSKIFGCPFEGCRKKMDSLRSLNIHLTRKHQAEFKIELDAGSHAITRMR